MGCDDGAWVPRHCGLNWRASLAYPQGKRRGAHRPHRNQPRGPPTHDLPLHTARTWHADRPPTRKDQAQFGEFAWARQRSEPPTPQRLNLAAAGAHRRDRWEATNTHRGASQPHLAFWACASLGVFIRRPHRPSFSRERKDAAAETARPSSRRLRIIAGDMASGSIFHPIHPIQSHFDSIPQAHEDGQAG